MNYVLSFQKKNVIIIYIIVPLCSYILVLYILYIQKES